MFTFHFTIMYYSFGLSHKNHITCIISEKQSRKTLYFVIIILLVILILFCVFKDFIIIIMEKYLVFPYGFLLLSV